MIQQRLLLQATVPAGLDRKETEAYLRLDPKRFPQHIAIIMDGNGRWAGRRHLPRVAGHRAGVEAVRSTVETAARIQIPSLTLYAFSEENWKRRPRSEVDFLMHLLCRYLKQEVLHLHRLANDLGGLRAEIDRFLDQFTDGSDQLLRYVGLYDD